MKLGIYRSIGCYIIAAGLSIGCTFETRDPLPENAIKIGLLAPFTGPIEPISRTIRNGAKLAVEEINNAGGVLGKPLGIIGGDDYSDTRIAKDQVKKLMSQGIVGLIGPYSSELATNITYQVAGEKNPIPLISPSASSYLLSDINDQNLFWRTVPSDLTHASIAAAQVFTELGTTASVIYEATEDGSNLAGAFQVYFQKQKDSKGTAGFIDHIDGLISYNPLTDAQSAEYTFETEIAKIIKVQPKVVVMVMNARDAARFTIQIKKYFSQGERPKLYGFHGLKSYDFLVNADKDVVEGMLGSSPIAPTKNDGDYNDSYKIYAQNYKQVYGFEPELFSYGAYDAVYLLAFALTKVGSVKPAEIKNHLAEISGMPDPSNKDRILGKVIYPNQFKEGVAEIKKGGQINYEGASGEIDWGVAENGDVSGKSYTFQIWKIEKNKSSGELQFKQKGDLIRINVTK